MRTAIVYSHRANKTKLAAKQIKDALNIKEIDDLDVENLSTKVLKDYDLLILGVPTWFDGELPLYWDELVPEIEDLDLKGKMVAIFGNGDQVRYPQNFGDAVGLMASLFQSVGATIIGETESNGYHFESSRAIHNNMFQGLILDFENQVRKNGQRISNWANLIDNQIVNNKMKNS
jgi:flavodoxin I